LAVVSESLIVVIDKEDVFRLEISMDEVESMQNYMRSETFQIRWHQRLTSDAREELFRKFLNM